MGLADSGQALDPIGVASSTDYNGKERVGEGLISHGRHAGLPLDEHEHEQGFNLPRRESTFLMSKKRRRNKKESPKKMSV